jgi:isochorismate synthase EntC
MVLPEVSFSRQAGRAVLTVNAIGDPEPVLERLRELRVASMPLIDPDPVVAPRVSSAAPPEHFEEAVARGVERIKRGELEKLVLARVVKVHASRAHDPAAVFGALRPRPSCWCGATARVHRPWR